MATFQEKVIIDVTPGDSDSFRSIAFYADELLSLSMGQHFPTFTFVDGTQEILAGDEFRDKRYGTKLMVDLCKSVMDKLVDAGVEDQYISLGQIIINISMVSHINTGRLDGLRVTFSNQTRTIMSFRPDEPNRAEVYEYILNAWKLFYEK